MRAAVLRELRRPLEIADVPTPSPGPGEALIATRTCGICRTDLHIQDGLAYVPSLPHIPGHEPAGVVADVGPGVTELKPGDRVVPHLFVRDGECRFTRAGQHAQATHLSGIIGVTRPGGFAEFFVAPAANLLAVPEGVSFEAAGLVSCAVITAVHAFHKASLAAGETALVLGAGGIGLILVQLLRSAAVRCVAMSRSPESLALAQAAGADAVVRTDAPDAAEQVRRFAGPELDGVHCVFEMVGLGRTMQLAADCVARCGKIVVIGEEAEYPPIDTIRIAQRELQIIGSRNGGLPDAREALDLLARGVIVPPIAARYPLDQINEALAAMRGGGMHGRVIIEIQSPALRGTVPLRPMPTPPDSPAALPWWRELSRYHWWVLTVATLGWLFDSMDQKLFVLARQPALRELLGRVSEADIQKYSGYATSIFILGWATGGLIFGLFGDRWGRTRTMMITILLYSLFTGLSALSRSWLDFAAYRFLCGMGIGGEYAAGVALVAEVMPSRARPYCLGLLQGLAALGQVAGSALSLVIGPQQEVHGVAGWRLLFCIGILPALLVVVIRWRLREPESWLRARSEQDELHKQMGDVREIFRDRTLRFHTLIGMTLGMAGQIGLWGIGFWSPELIRGAQVQQRQETVQVVRPLVIDGQATQPAGMNLRQLATATSHSDAKAEQLAAEWIATDDRYVAWATVLQDLAGMCGICAFTYLTARTGRRPAFAVSYLLALAATIFVFSSLTSGRDALWMIPILGFCVSSVYGGFAIYFPELFPTRLRSTGTGFCYNVARYITAMGPLALGNLTVMYSRAGYGLPLRPAAVTLALVYLIGLAVLPWAPETKGRPLPE